MMGVSRSGYYSWLNERSEREARRIAQEKLVVEVFNEGRGHYGADRICGIIRSRGGSISFAKARDIMKKHSLESSHNRRRQRSLTDSRNSRDASYKNLLKDESIVQDRQILSSDI
ncbi:MAG: IS3 family transposase [Clostridiaceae bacterium]|nr:IS3 family transposase [Clostridiaceae bacterium]